MRADETSVAESPVTHAHESAVDRPQYMSDLIKPGGEWVKVSERLPECECWVAVKRWCTKSGIRQRETAAVRFIPPQSYVIVKGKLMRTGSHLWTYKNGVRLNSGEVVEWYERPNMW